MGIAQRYEQWRSVRRRRSVIGQLMAAHELVELEWRPPIGSPLRSGDSTVRLPLDSIIGPRTLAYGHWHDEHAALIRELLVRRPGQRYFLIDIGANIGLVTRQLLAPDPPRWTGACCFEPEAKNFAQLSWNLQGLPNVHVHPCAVSNRSATGTLHVDLGNAGDCSLEPFPQTVQRAGTRDESVQIISGEEAFGRIQQHRVAGDRLVWKSDTQGHDLTIVSAMPASLWPQVDVAMIELRCSSASDAEIDVLLRVARDFPHRFSVKRGKKPVTMDELEAFCRRRAESEFDLLLHR